MTDSAYRQSVVSVPTDYVEAANVGLDLYLVRGKGSAVLIDAGISTTPSSGTADSISELLDGRSLSAILITHAHLDHVGGAVELRDRFGARILVPRDDVGWIEDPAYQWHAFWATYRDVFDIDKDRAQLLAWSGPPFRSDGLIRDGDVVDVGGTTVRAILTRAHTPGHTCYYAEQARVIFSGDFLQGWGNPSADRSFVYAPLYDSVDDYLSGLDTISNTPFESIATAHRGVLSRSQGLAMIADSKQFVGEVEAHVATLAASTSGADVVTLATAIADHVGAQPALTVQTVGTARAHLRFGVQAGRLHVDRHGRYRP